jgi:hypothetical protein
MLKNGKIRQKSKNSSKIEKIQFNFFPKHDYASLTLIQGMELAYRHENFLFSPGKHPSGANLCGESIAHIF